MKKLGLSIFLVSVASASLQATPLFSDNFDSYSNAGIIGQGPWVITGTSVVNPIQVSSGSVSLVATGQDVNAALAGTINYATDPGFYYGVTLNLSSAGTGDYFLHTSPAGSSSSFFARLFVKSSGSGYLLGYQGSSTTPATYGSSILDFGVAYRVVVAYNFVAGSANDTAAIYVNPLSVVQSENTAYVSANWTGGTEPTTVGAINLRQGGGSSSAPTLVIDDLAVSLSFADVAVVPEPSTFALLGLAGIAFVLRRRAAK